ncbi:hypothetical protein NDN08_005418 [Rhodosorus marinus]|uniref:ATP-dependent RNA helicase n=1 Tax=Rhodosorus marinus TaxID=101924 RepID=A0AAV8V3T5_9RHOD|nr:hypothetical protein NDN08_005418 [Rhodosorus marinus]
MSFQELGLRNDLCRFLTEDLGWAIPRPVQAETIAQMLCGRDLCVVAPTGSGKTAAFCLPLVQRCIETQLKPSQPVKHSTDTLKWRAENCNIKSSNISARRANGWGYARADIPVTEGKCYYEVQTLSDGICRLGWATSNSSKDLGSDAFGFGYGATGVKVHNSSFETYGSSFSAKGRTVGCALDTEARKMWFILDGVSLGDAFEYIPTAPLFPAICVKDATVRVIFEAAKLKFDPPPGFKALLGMSSKRRGQTSSQSPLAVIVEPNADLALQVYSFLVSCTSQLEGDLRIPIGGSAKRTERSNGVEGNGGILVATPARLDDLCSSGQLSLNTTKMIVVDEADVLASSSTKQIRKICDFPLEQSQVSFFSATLPSAALNSLSSDLQVNPEWVKLHGLPIPTSVHILVHYISKTNAGLPSHGPQPLDAEGLEENSNLPRVELHPQKVVMLMQIISELSIGRAIVYVRTRKEADGLSKALHSNGISSIVHGSSPRAVEEFRSGKVRFLVASDGGERGLDIPDLDYVVLLSVPESTHKFVHRVGRIGRNNRRGKAFVIASPNKEKVWYHTCRKGHSTCKNIDRCTRWMDEANSLEKIDRELGGVLKYVDDQQGGTAATGRTVTVPDLYHLHTLPATRRLAELERAAQLSYLSYLQNKR